MTEEQREKKTVSTADVEELSRARAEAQAALDALGEVSPAALDKLVLRMYARQVSQMRAAHEAPPKGSVVQRVEVELTLNVVLDLDAPTCDWRVGAQFGQRVICGVDPQDVDQEQAMLDFWAVPVLMPKVFETCDGMRGARVVVLPTAQGTTRRMYNIPRLGGSGT